MSRETNKAFCILPWIHMAVFPEGSAKLCCVANERINQVGSALSLNSNEFEEVWNSQYMRDVRRDMVAGKPVKDCASCYRAENNVGQSWRTQSNERWQSELGSMWDSLVRESASRHYAVGERPIYYQLMPGNLCNLKCRMCFPTFSSLIEKDEIHKRWSPALFEGSRQAADPAFFRSPEPREGRVDRLPTGPWYRDDVWVRETLLENAEKLRGLYFTGGEPMIEKQVENILDHLIARGVAGSIMLEFNTNCTVLREPMLEKLQRFKCVRLGLSLDAYGIYHEYIRYPSNWRHIQANVEKLVALSNDQFTICAAPVLQVYNALNLVEALRFFDQLGIHYQITIASLPWFLSVNILPLRIRQLAAERLRMYATGRAAQRHLQLLSVAAHLEATPDRSNSESLRTLMLFTNDLDASRRQSVSEVHPELIALLKESGFEWTDERSPTQRSRPPMPPRKRFWRMRSA